MALATEDNPPGVKITLHTTHNSQQTTTNTSSSSDDEWQVVPSRKNPKPSVAKPRAEKRGGSQLIKQHTSSSARPLCTHFAKGHCRNGNKCRFLHPTSSTQPTQSIKPDTSSPLPKPGPKTTCKAFTEPVKEAPPKQTETSPEPTPQEPTPQEPIATPDGSLTECSTEQSQSTRSPDHARVILENKRLEDGAAPEHCVSCATQPVTPAIPSWAACAGKAPVKAQPVVDPLLQHKWVFWEHRNLPRGGGTDNSYHHAIGYVGEAKTAGEFWSVFNNLPAPSQFFTAPPKPRSQVGGRLVEGWSLFRHGVQPEWEDPKNSSGAEITASTDSLAQIDAWWEHTLLAVIGGVLSDAEEITGVRVIDKSKKGSKPVYRLELWFTEELDPKPLKLGLIEQLDGFQGGFKMKQHGNQKPIAKAAKQDAQVDTAGRVKEVRALLAKLTPERFERLTPQLQGLLGDGSEDTVTAVVNCIRVCTMQTNIFHGMYADLVQALAETPGVGTGVVQTCLDQLADLSEETRHDAKNAASFAVELCARNVMPSPSMMDAIKKFGSGPVDLEVLCTLLTKLLPLKSFHNNQLADCLDWLEGSVKSGQLPARLRFMAQDVLKLR